jgi:hypothetical protein
MRLIKRKEKMQYDQYREARANYNKAKLIVAKARKGGEAAKDVAEAVKGVRDNKRKKRFWEKKPFQNAVAAAAIMAGTGATLKYGPKLAEKVLLANRARNIHLRKMGHNIIDLDDFNVDIELDELDDAREAGWQVRNPTSSSIKIQRSGRRKRERRKKTTSETVGFKNKLIAGLGAGLVGTAGLGAYLAMLTRKRGKLLKASGTKTNLKPTLTKGEKALLEQAEGRGKFVPFKKDGTDD